MRLALCFSVLALFVAACGTEPSVEVAEGASTAPLQSTTTTTTSDEATPTDIAASARQASEESFELETTAFNGRPLPRTVSNAGEAAALFIEVERALRVDGEPPEVYADLGHTEQVLIRTLMRHPEWIDPFRAALPDDLLVIADLHITARKELGLLHAGSTAPPLENIPAWEIIEPAPLDELVSHYKSAGAESGIAWQVLAGINLVETGMGRIDGLSSAGAQGPMQFLPTTWEEVSNGGDINDPEDAISGAARYLVRRGGLDDIREGLWGYNNSDNYVNAVLAYRDLVTLDERALRGFYNWEIYVGTASGTLWLPVGFRTDEPTPAAAYLAQNPWALTLR